MGKVSLFRSASLTLQMIKVEHSVFALPFALLSAMVAADGIPSWRVLGWILVAMITARSAGMAFNRLTDREYDKKNPRTARWPLAAGLLTPAFVASFVIVCSAIFIFAAYKLNRLAFYLSPMALAILLFYSLTKRFTALSHWFVGLALGIAPAGAWVAVKGSLDLEPVLLSFAILFWTAGFDLIYSCQDAEFDRAHNLYSIPSRYGIPLALKLSALCHLVMLGFLIAFGIKVSLGIWYFAGVAFIAALLTYEHTLVSPNNLTRVNEAFFSVNGLIGVLLLLSATLDMYL